MDIEIVQTLALSLTQTQSPEAVAEIVRWILDEVCGEADAPLYNKEARRLVDEALAPHSCEATLDAILRARTLSNDGDRPGGYGTPLTRVEVG